jgi:hypothetical protein
LQAYGDRLLEESGPKEEAVRAFERYAEELRQETLRRKWIYNLERFKIAPPEHKEHFEALSKEVAEDTRDAFENLLWESKILVSPALDGIPDGSVSSRVTGARTVSPYSDRDDKVFKMIGEKNFRQLSNDDIGRRFHGALREVWGRRVKLTKNALRSCLNRIRRHHGLPKSRQIRNNAVND